MSMIIGRTTRCADCEHTFLSYAKSCPECGWKRPRRRKRRIGRVIAISVSVIAFATALVTIRHLQSSKDNLLARQEPTASAFPAPPARAKKSRQKETSSATMDHLIQISGNAHTQKSSGLSLENVDGAGIASLPNP